MVTGVQIDIGNELETILNTLRAQGGYPLIVGGTVRDASMGLPRSKDCDVEVYGLSLHALVDALTPFGRVDLVGARFGVVKVSGVGADFSVPRYDNTCGVGHRDFQVVVNQNMSIEEACRRRDLTINSMAYDPLTGDLHDPFRGLNDIREKVLRATEKDTFLDDPLRAMRVAQFVSRFGFRVDSGLEHLCAQADLCSLPGERLYTEWQKLLLGQYPDQGLRFLRATNLLRFFPEINALVECQQDGEWHREGDVFEHTALALSAARTFTDNLTVLWAVLLHDVGKPATTTHDDDGRIRSRGHEDAGIAPTRTFLQRLRAPKDLEEQVVALVAHHLAPAHFVPDAARSHKRRPASPSAYRRLARTLATARSSMKELYLVSKADHLGRLTPDAIAKQFPSGEEFLRRSEQIDVTEKSEPDVVMGRHLLALGYQPGPEIGAMLVKCREYQYESGEKNPDIIREQVLSHG